MTEAERLHTEISDLERKVRHARQENRRGALSERQRADLRMMEQTLQALKQRRRQRRDRSRESADSSPETMERKLDSALADSFPGSDPVSFLEPAPRKPAGRR
jgi:phage-related minor tail protein